MSVHTLSLSALVLICAAFPTQLIRVAAMTFAGLGAVQRDRAERYGMPVLAGTMAALAWVVSPMTAPSWAPQAMYWLAIAVAAGLIAPLWEVGVGYGYALLSRQNVRHVALHGRAPSASLTAVISVSTVALCEEIIFRQLGIGLLTNIFAWPVAAAIAVTAVVYGFNHLYFGWLTVAQKSVTGVAYGLLYIGCGNAILVPMIAHVVHNVVVLTVIPRWGGRA